MIEEVAALRPPSTASGRTVSRPSALICANGYGGQARTNPAMSPGFELSFGASSTAMSDAQVYETIEMIGPSTFSMFDRADRIWQDRNCAVCLVMEDGARRSCHASPTRVLPTDAVASIGQRLLERFS